MVSSIRYKKNRWIKSIRHGLNNIITAINNYAKKGVIAANGPFADGSGGCIVYNCSKEEFVSIIESDPLVVNGVVDYEYKEWNAAF